MRFRSKAGVTVMELLLVLAIFLVMAVVLTPFVRVTKTWARRIECADNLRRINLGLQLYANAHDGAYPAELGTLYPAYVTNAKAFDCPASKHIGTPAHPDFEYNAGLNRRSPGTAVVAQDQDGNHGRAGKNVLFADGSVAWVKVR